MVELQARYQIEVRVHVGSYWYIQAKQIRNMVFEISQPTRLDFQRVHSCVYTHTYIYIYIYNIISWFYELKSRVHVQIQQFNG